MRSIAICDDDPHDLEILRQMTVNYLNKRGLDLAVETYSDGDTLLSALTDEPNRCILILLDILLGTKNGVTLAKRLRAYIWCWPPISAILIPTAIMSSLQRRSGCA